MRFRDGMRHWNMTVQWWLAHYVHRRAPRKPPALRCCAGGMGGRMGGVGGRWGAIGEGLGAIGGGWGSLGGNRRGLGVIGGGGGHWIIGGQ